MAISGLINLGGPVLTHRQSYNPTLDAGLTNATSTAEWWRVGQHVFVEGTIALSGNGGGAEDLVVTFLSDALLGYVIDTSVLSGGTSSTNQLSTMLGYGYWFIQGSGWKFIYPSYNSTTSVFFVENTQHIQASELNSGDGFKYFIQAPIVGW